MQAIAFWEKQIDDMEQCIATYGFSSPEDEEDEGDQETTEDEEDE
jgi:hypothetical protein